MEEIAPDQITETRWRRPLRPRDTDETDRAATSLELFFDLCFVVAVSFAATRLHHSFAEAQFQAGLISYVRVFFAIWWAWMNFTWFASAYDNDDAPYRALTFVQISGVLVLAAGVPAAFDDRNFMLVTAGYLIMRLALVVQWLRAARSDPERRPSTMRYAIGVTLCQIGWLIGLALPEELYVIYFPILVIAEISVPIWAETLISTPWNAHHIAERYSLFTLIVLGESVLATTIAVQSAFDFGDVKAELAFIAICGLIIVFSMWWVYFDQPAHHLLKSTGLTLRWGYGHFLIFASASTVGVGLRVVIDQLGDEVHISAVKAGLTIAIPVAIYLVSVWALHIQPHGGSTFQMLLLPTAAALILAAGFTGIALPLIAAIMLVMVVLFVVTAAGRNHSEFSD